MRPGEEPEDLADEIPRRTLRVLQTGAGPAAMAGLLVALTLAVPGSLLVAADGFAAPVLLVELALACAASVLAHGAAVAVFVRSTETARPCLVEALDILRSGGRGAARPASVMLGAALVLALAARAVLAELSKPERQDDAATLATVALFGAWIHGAALLRLASALVPRERRMPRTSSRFALAPVVGLLVPVAVGAFLGPSALGATWLANLHWPVALIRVVVGSLAVAAAFLASCALAVVLVSAPSPALSRSAGEGEGR